MTTKRTPLRIARDEAEHLRKQVEELKAKVADLQERLDNCCEECVEKCPHKAKGGGT